MSLQLREESFFLERRSGQECQHHSQAYRLKTWVNSASWRTLVTLKRGVTVKWQGQEPDGSKVSKWNEAVNRHSFLEKSGDLTAKVIDEGECWTEELLCLFLSNCGTVLELWHVQATIPRSCKSPKGFKPSYALSSDQFTNNVNLEVSVHTYISSPYCNGR